MCRNGTDLMLGWLELVLTAGFFHAIVAGWVDERELSGISNCASLETLGKNLPYFGLLCTTRVHSEMFP